jgi:hypothetical protein
MQRIIVSVERLRNSVNGNPRHLVTFDDGSSANTVADAFIGTVVANEEYLGVPVDVTFEGQEIRTIEIV